MKERGRPRHSCPKKIGRQNNNNPFIGLSRRRKFPAQTGFHLTKVDVTFGFSAKGKLKKGGVEIAETTAEIFYP